FFSSRRRHTRSYGDWSSDVCSSDLQLPGLDSNQDKENQNVSPGFAAFVRHHPGTFAPLDLRHERIPSPSAEIRYCPPQWLQIGRSEERRVGKECRSRGAPSQ